MARIRLCLVGAIALVAVSCQDHGLPTAARPPISAEFFDATHGGGNRHFYLLPPLVSTPDLTKETFESGLQPSVRITELPGAPLTPFAGCTDELITYLPATEFTRLKAYAAFWRPANFPNVAAPCIYRLQVELFGTRSKAGTVLGFADVQVISKTTVKYLKTGQYIPLPKDLTLPFWFFIGQGAVFFAQTDGKDACRPDRDCVEAVISPAKDNVVLTKNQEAGILIPKDAFGAFAGPITLVIEEETARPCILGDNLGLPQFAENRTGCYRYQRFPSDVRLTKDLTVAMCVEVGLLTHEQADRLQIFRFDPDEQEGEGVAEALANASAFFLPCDATRPRGLPALLNGLRALFAPRPLHAATAVTLIHRGVGGTCVAGKCLSSPIFTWGLPAEVRINDGNNQAASAGSTLLISPSVVVKDSGGTGVAGAIVTFSVAAGNGTITGAVDTTGADGIARVGGWTLSSRSGTYALTASLPGAGGSPLTFTATGTAAAGQISFSRRAGLTAEEIFLVNVDGTGEVNLTNNSALDAEPQWSPDGSKIAFQSRRNDIGDVFVMNADGSNPVDLTNNASAFEITPIWSRDGTKIAYMNRTPFDQIFVMNPDGSNNTFIAGTAAADAGFPSWSSDGAKLAFATGRDGNSEIYVMNADGSNPVNLTGNPGFDLTPAWSPDGTKIAWFTTRDGNGEIYVMNADGSNPVNVTNNSALDRLGGWSPDGRFLVFSSDRDGNNEIYITAIDGSLTQRVTFNAAEDLDPAWRP